MIEKRFAYVSDDAKRIEKLIDDDEVMINHIILPKGEKVPDHSANSHVHMIVIRGEITLELGNQEPHAYAKDSILDIPYGTPMKIRNEKDEVCEFFVIKSPSPRVYQK